MFADMNPMLRCGMMLAFFGLTVAAAPVLLAVEAVQPALTAEAPPPVSPILPAEFLGWTNSFRLQNDRAEAVLVPAIGRLVHFAPHN